MMKRIYFSKISFYNNDWLLKTTNSQFKDENLTGIIYVDTLISMVNGFSISPLFPAWLPGKLNRRDEARFHQFKISRLQTPNLYLLHPASRSRFQGWLEPNEELTIAKRERSSLCPPSPIALGYLLPLHGSASSVLRAAAAVSQLRSWKKEKKFFCSCLILLLGLQLESVSATKRQALQPLAEGKQGSKTLAAAGCQFDQAIMELHAQVLK